MHPTEPGHSLSMIAPFAIAVAIALLALHVATGSSSWAASAVRVVVGIVAAVAVFVGVIVGLAVAPVAFVLLWLLVALPFYIRDRLAASANAREEWRRRVERALEQERRRAAPPIPGLPPPAAGTGTSTSTTTSTSSRTGTRP